MMLKSAVSGLRGFTTGRPYAARLHTTSPFRRAVHTNSRGSSEGQHTPLAHRPRSLLVAGCALLGLWTATGYVYLNRSSIVYLDSEDTKLGIKRTSSSSEGESTVVAEQSSVDQELRREEATRLAPPGCGVSRYDTVRLASNNPVEDQHSEAILPTPSGYWSFFGLYDGHSGPETGIWLADNLIPAVAGALADLYSRSAATSDPEPPVPAESDIERTIKDTFNRLDDDLVNTPLETIFASNSKYIASTLLTPAYAGSCALLSFYDSHSGLLHTAITGDSRALLGRPTYDESGNPTGNYEVHVLTADQNGWNPLERERIEAAHPGEDIVHNGRVAGIGVSRAFGDARFKWSLDVQRRLQREYLGRSIYAAVKTPPYLSAEPVVTSIAIRPGDFLILGSDGLWECLTNEEAVGLVGQWKNLRSSARSLGGRDPAANSGVVLRSPELPVQRPDAGEGHGDEKDTVRYRQWGAKKGFVSGDANAATHLLRNALGGADVDLTAALLSLRGTRSRTYRDDITISVVFFDEQDRRASA